VRPAIDHLRDLITEQKFRKLTLPYSALTVPQLKGMLGAALADHKRELAEIKSKWSSEISALREAMSKNSARLTSELQTTKNRSAALQRELDALYCELEKANTLIVDQGRKLAAHSEVAELEKRLQIARRSAS
jgi:predicted  nucleic acid-binding Zn-ribbon protein